MRPTTLPPLLSLLALVACRGAPPRRGLPAARVSYPAKAERVPDPRDLVPHPAAFPPPPPVRIERVTAAVPWPRGMVWLDGRLIVLARGRHRRAGGLDPSVPDRAGCLFEVDPAIAEEVVPGRKASPRVARNARLLARPSRPPFRLYDPAVPPREARGIDRPYCTLILDPRSWNLFICGFAGVDLPGGRFLKNAADTIHRYDLRTGRWHLVEMHDPSVVPAAELGYVVPNQYFPHHDPAQNPPPHGWLNGPDGGCVSGRYLLCAGKDNHLVAAYDLSRIRRDPEAGPPESFPVLGPRLRVRTPQGVRRLEVLGPSALVRRGPHLYVGYRTTSVVLRFRVGPEGLPRPDEPADLIAVFEPWRPEAKRSANLIDLAFGPDGALYVSCAKNGRIWRIPDPDPAHPFSGDDRPGRRTSAPPFADLGVLTGKKTNCGNLLFDPQGRLYVCAGNYDTRSKTLAGVIYRLTPSPRRRAGD